LFNMKGGGIWGVEEGKSKKEERKEKTQRKKGRRGGGTLAQREDQRSQSKEGDRAQNHFLLY